MSGFCAQLKSWTGYLFEVKGSTCVQCPDLFAPGSRCFPALSCRTNADRSHICLLTDVLCGLMIPDLPDCHTLERLTESSLSPLRAAIRCTQARSVVFAHSRVGPWLFHR